MVVGKTAQARRKATKRPPSYYQNLRRKLAVKGRTAPKHADNTKKSKNHFSRSGAGLSYRTLLCAYL